MSPWRRKFSSLIIPTLPGDSAPSLADIATPGLLASGIRPLSTISLHSTGDLLNRGGFTNINSSTASAYQSQVDLAYYGLNIAGTIETDPLGTINLAGDQIAAVSGTVEAPGGTINFTGGTFTYFGATQPAIDLQGEGLWLTDTGKLLAPGVAVTSLQSNGQPYDDVLSGGSINVTGSYVILAPGSLIDVAGTSGLATLGAAGSSSSTNQTGGSGSIIPPTTVDSAGGTVSITSILGGILEGTLSGQAGGGNASGGTLIITQEGHGQEKNGDPLPRRSVAGHREHLHDPRAHDRRCLLPERCPDRHARNEPDLPNSRRSTPIPRSRSRWSRTAASRRSTSAVRGRLVQVRAF